MTSAAVEQRVGQQVSMLLIVMVMVIDVVIMVATMEYWSNVCTARYAGQQRLDGCRNDVLGLVSTKYSG